MKRLELTCETPAENLALDDALLESAFESKTDDEVLRIWHPAQNFVVLGRSSPARKEVHLDYCRQHQIPVLRRCSGGQTIVTGPGCLMYGLLLDYRQRPHLRSLDNAHRFVMDQLRRSILALGFEVEMQGTSDLTYQGRKFSGNSMRCKKDWMIYHGTILLDFDLDLVSRCLNRPIREPDYRQGRTHATFLTCLPVDHRSLIASLIQQWQADREFESWPTSATKMLAQEKYQSDRWTFKI